MVVVSTLLVLLCFLGLVVFEFFRHWWQGDALWEVWKWVNEVSLLAVVVEERAAFTKLAFTSLEVVLAWHGLVVRVDSSESGLAEVVWKWL